VSQGLQEIPGGSQTTLKLEATLKIEQKSSKSITVVVIG
jgi:hypothetical protein